MTLHNTTQISEKFSPIVSKIWHFLKCHNNCYFNKRKLLTHKNLKEQLTAHTPIVKRIMVSVTNTHLSSSNALLCQLVPQMHKLLKQLKPMDIANYNINRYNGLVLLVLKAAFPSICSTCRCCQIRRNIQQ